MAQPLWNIPFPVQNSQRNYPFSAEVTMLDTSGSFTIPDDFIVGLDFAIHAGLNTQSSRFYIKTINVFDSGFGLILGYDDGATFPDIATTWIPRESHTRNAAYYMGGVGIYQDAVGKIVIGRFDDIDLQPQGAHSFTVAAARVEPETIRQITNGVSSISVQNGSEISGPFYGDIHLIANENMQITPSVNGSTTELLFSAIEGEGLAESCVCDGDSTAPCITRINGIPATANQDFIILGSTCLVVEAIANGLRLTDVCSEPCCGCKELEEITDDLVVLGSNVTTLDTFVRNVEIRTTQFNQIVLGSTLSDSGCFECE